MSLFFLSSVEWGQGVALKFTIKKFTDDAIDEIIRIAIKLKNVFNVNDFNMKIMI